MSDPNDSTSTCVRVPLCSTFLEFCAKVREDDSSILPKAGKPFSIGRLSEEEDMELADALLENTSVTYLRLEAAIYTKRPAESMAKYMRTSKRLQRICWLGNWTTHDRLLHHQREEMVCCFMPAIQESTSLKELDINLPPIGGPSNLALENMLTHTKSLRSLSLICPDTPLKDWAVAAAMSGLEKNTTLRELKLVFPRGATSISSLSTSLRSHPLLKRLCLHGQVADLTGLETLLLSDTSKITELEIDRLGVRRPWIPIVGLPQVLQALGHRRAFTKLGLRHYSLGRDEARLLGIALGNIRSLQSLDLSNNTLGSAGFAYLAPALSRNTSIKVLDMSRNNLNDFVSAALLRDILRHNKTITTLDLSRNTFGRTTADVRGIAGGLVSNLTLLKIDLSSCALADNGVSILAQSLGSRNTKLQKLTLGWNYITSKGVGVLLEAMEQSHPHITDLDLHHNPIGPKGASLLAMALGTNSLPNLKHLSLFYCCIGDDGFIAMISALEQNTSLLHLDLRDELSPGISERVFLALAEILPEIRVLQRVDFIWCTGLASAMPLLLAGLRKNTSLFRFHVTDCTPSSVPPTPEEMVRCAGGWMQEMERVGYRNRFRTLIRAPIERLPPRGIWPHALARVATLHDVIFEVLHSKPSLVPSANTGGKEAAKDIGVPNKCILGDE
jgi:Ran GTPase-activating protein (RanGAP) involved in mRNA processing and transport